MEKENPIYNSHLKMKTKTHMHKIENSREMLDIPTLFSKIWFQTDVSQSYEIVTHFPK
jgi:hypothetical protein